jgi:hypothetical protein
LRQVVPPRAVSAAYTPTYLGGTTAGATTYTTQEGWYARINNLVFVNGIVVWTAATGTGSAVISLPFVIDVTRARATAVVRTINVTFANGSIQVIVSSTLASFTMESPLTNAGSTAVAVEAAGNVTFSLWYPVAS